jgi:hypothetical protein|nr:MAG TPA: DNA methyltransferase [Caudoviricetes sp.]
MKVLVACEESQEVCKAFRALGHEAYSCDVQEPSGGHPEWHICGDALKAIEGGVVTTMDGQTHDVNSWDLLIAHPPCTYLTITGNRWFNIERYGRKAVIRWQLRAEAAIFFMSFIKSDVPKIAVENPVGCMSTYYRKPDCIIQPYEFGHHARKKTCLWLKGLPSLQPTNIVDAGEIMPGGYSVGANADCARDETGKILRWNDPRTAKARSKTFPGIAKAMAEQWGGVNDAL